MERGALGLRVHETPELRSPTLIAAFSGWNDAREVATQAVQFLVRVKELIEDPSLLLVEG